MGWGSYLVDKQNKVKIYLHRTTEEQFLEEVATVKRVLQQLEELERGIYDIREVKLQDLTIRDLVDLVTLATIATSLSGGIHWFPVMYYLHMSEHQSDEYLSEEFDFYSETDEQKELEYKDYKLLEPHFYFEEEVADE